MSNRRYHQSIATPWKNNLRVVLVETRNPLNIGAAAAIYFPTILAAALVASYAVYLLLEVAPYRAAFGEVIFRFRPERDGRRLDQRPSAEERVAPLLGPAQSSPGRMGD